MDTYIAKEEQPLALLAGMQIGKCLVQSLKAPAQEARGCEFKPCGHPHELRNPDKERDKGCGVEEGEDRRIRKGGKRERRDRRETRREKV